VRPTLNDPTEAHDPGSVPAPDLQRALEDLTAERQRRLAELIAETRRCDELEAALSSDSARVVRERRGALGEAILELLMGWQALGGEIALQPPPGLTASEPEVTEVATTPERSAGSPPPPVPARPPARGAPDGPPDDSSPLPDHGPPATGPKPIRAQDTVPPGPGVPTEPSQDWPEDLARLLGDIATTANAQDEMEAIQQATSASFTRWAQYPRSVQRALVGNMACRLRHLQDYLGVTGVKLDSAFRSLTRFSKSFQPGWVNGLTRGRGPAAESWAAEGRVWWDQLMLSADGDAQQLPEGGADAPSEAAEACLDAVRSWLSEWRDAPAVAKPMCLDKTLTAIQAALDGGVSHTDPELCRLADEIYDHLELSRFRRLRQGIRDLELADREERGIDQPEAVPSEWAWWSHTVGRRALLLGQDLERSRIQQVEGAFGLAELRWHPLDASSSEASLRSVLSGGVDLVMLVGGHPGEPQVRTVIRSCQVRGLPWIHVERSVGVTRVRMAIERFLQPDPRPEGGTT
jgi:hypothetical protein